MSWLVKFLRRQNSPNHVLISHKTQTLLIINQNTEKVLEFYSVKNNDPQLLFKLKPKKKVKKIWSQKDFLFFVDKFGDVYCSNLNGIFEERDDPKHDDLFTLVTSFFSDTLDLILCKDKKAIIHTDDYYKIKIVDVSNPQRILAIHAFRPFWAFKIFEIGNLFFFFYDDFKILMLKGSELLVSGLEVDEKCLIGFKKTNYERFFDELIYLEDNKFVGIYFIPEEKSVDLVYFSISSEEGIISNEIKVKIPNIEDEFVMFENKKIHFKENSVDLIEF